MTKFNSSFNMGAAGALLLLALPMAARAQEGNAIGNPQLRDFQLPGQRRVVAQPPPAPVVAAPPPATTTQPRAQAPAPARDTQARPVQPAPRQQAPAQAPAPTQTQAQPPAAQPVPAATPIPLPAPAVPVAEAAPQPAPPAAAEPTAGFPWLYAIPAAALALLGFVLLLRRRRGAEAEAEAEAEAKYEPEIVEQRPVAVAPAPVAEPVRRPWLELTLRVERASANLTETIVQFELEIANNGESAARNLRIDVKMFNAGAEQDKEIGAFFGTAGRESTKLNLPGLAAGASGIIRGEVAMKRDDMRAVVLEEKYLFIPMLAANALYDWGEGRTGQTSKSYVVGRELEQSAKMGAFRVDQGPRVWRTIGQRPHTLERRV